jgi:hypothetical protein
MQMKRILFTLSVLVVGALATAWWVSTRPALAVDAVAQCIASKLTPFEKEKLGASGAMAGDGEVIRVSRWDFLDCRGNAAIFASKPERVELAKALIPALEKSSDFQRGMQAAAWNRQGFRGALGDRLTALTIFSGRQTVERVWGMGCNKLSKVQADELRDIELPLLTAMAGTQGWVTTADRARAVADNIINQGKYHALMGAESAASDCANPAMSAGLLRQQEDALKFMAGTHPGALGCKAVAEGGEFVLVCGAAAK